jgi:D-alanyl-D-alanine carboxypeptidase
MNKVFKNKTFISTIAISAIIIILLISREFRLLDKIKNLESDLSSVENVLSEKENVIQILIKEKTKLEDELGQTVEELEDLDEQLGEEAKRNKEILNLITIEEELLQKYSKVSFLNEHYSPKNLESVDKDFWTNPNKLIDVDARVHPFLEDLLEDAEDDGIDLKVTSGYRSFGTQSSLKASYLVQYGSGANTFSADQGYSEHQLGTAVDFTSSENGGALNISFEETEAFKWLEDNAHKYGFIMSYPQGNTYYQYEPWHWRFVSRDLADDLHDNDKNFYDLDQRDIWEYLADFFD